MAASDKKHHWVEDLFPPTFRLELNDILRDKTFFKTASKSQENSEECCEDIDNACKKPSVFEQLASGVSPLDVTAIRNVYERVWLMMHLAEQEQKKQEGKDDLDKMQVADGPRRRRSVKQRDVSTSTVDLSSQEEDKSCIWNSKEIDVLRVVFKSTKEENAELKAKLAESEMYAKRLLTKCKKQATVSEKQHKGLSEAEKANTRFQILSVNLKEQLDEEQRKVQILQEELASFQREQSESLREMHELRKALDRERIDRRRVEAELKCQHREFAREQKLEDEKLKLLHQDDIDFLQDRITKLTNELREEKKSHSRTTLGLTHLRQHFSSLSTAGESPSPGVVVGNQLEDLQY